MRYAGFAAMMVSLFLAVTIGTAAVLFLINGGPPAAEIEIICPTPSPVMPEDLGRTDQEARVMQCR
jgi:hypothetical protein